MILDKLSRGVIVGTLLGLGVTLGGAKVIHSQGNRTNLGDILRTEERVYLERELDNQSAYSAEPTNFYEIEKRVLDTDAIMKQVKIVPGRIIDDVDWEAKEEEMNFAPCNMSSEGLNLLKKFEGFKPRPYLCQAGRSTIGYGHLILPGEKFTKISREEGEELLRDDVGVAEDIIQRNVKVPLNWNQYDALCSFAYNIGETKFKRSTLLKHLNSERYDLVAEEFGKWNKVTVNGKKVPSRGLTSRRNDEEELFRK